MFTRGLAKSWFLLATPTPQPSWGQLVRTEESSALTLAGRACARLGPGILAVPLRDWRCWTGIAERCFHSLRADGCQGGAAQGSRPHHAASGAHTSLARALTPVPSTALPLAGCAAQANNFPSLGKAPAREAVQPS